MSADMSQTQALRYIAGTSLRVGDLPVVQQNRMCFPKVWLIEPNHRVLVYSLISSQISPPSFYLILHLPKSLGNGSIDDRELSRITLLDPLCLWHSYCSPSLTYVFCHKVYE